MTNRERINALTDVEFSKLIIAIASNEFAPWSPSFSEEFCLNGCIYFETNDCPSQCDAELWWLSQEVDEKEFEKVLAE